MRVPQNALSFWPTCVHVKQLERKWMERWGWINNSPDLFPATYVAERSSSDTDRDPARLRSSPERPLETSVVQHRRLDKKLKQIVFSRATGAPHFCSRTEDSAPQTCKQKCEWAGRPLFFALNTFVFWMKSPRPFSPDDSSYNDTGYLLSRLLR